MKVPSLDLLPGAGSPRLRRLFLGGAILAGAALASASLFATGPAPEPEVRIEKAWPVAVMAAEPRTQSPSFTAYGRVESTRIAHLATDLVADVRAVHVREGDWVAKGDLLLELDDAEIRLLLAERSADLAQQQATLRSIESQRAMLERTLAQARSMDRIAAAKLARHEELLSRRLISQSLQDEVVAEANRAAIDLESHQRRLADLPNQIAAQRAAVDRARALVQRAELDLARTGIRAPFAGPVLAVNVAPGDRSNLSRTLLELADASGFEVRVQIPAGYEPRFQHHLDRAASGQSADEISASLADGRSLTLVRLARLVRAGQSGLDAFFRLDDVAALPPIGRVLDLRIRLPEEPGVVALPIASLYENDRVYAVEDNRLQAISVERVGELHTADGEYRVLVRAPELVAGRPVITTQLPKAVSGLLVEPS
ncbi:MAG: biotin/lipoyl-binding protein [Pseudomonadales bacterium]